MTTKALHKKVAIMVMNRQFNSLIFMCDIYTAYYLVNEAQVPPTGLLCEV